MSIYCTYITFYRGNKLPPFYIGSTSVEKVNNGYHGSVNSREYREIWNKEILYNPHLFETKIISRHLDRKDATAKELQLQLKTNAPNNPLYINRGFARKNFAYGVIGLINNITGTRGPRSEQAKANIRQGIANNKHKPRSEAQIEGNKKSAAKRTGQKRQTSRSLESRKLQSNKMKGKPNKNKGKKMKDICENYIHPMQDKHHSEETKEKQRISAMLAVRQEWSDEHKTNHLTAVSGANSNTARKINICDSFGEIVYMCEGNFTKTLEKYNLPKSALCISLREDGRPIFSRTNKYFWI